jgi:hypothetical protein
LGQHWIKSLRFSGLIAQRSVMRQGVCALIFRNFSDVLLQCYVVHVQQRTAYRRIAEWAWVQHHGRP